MNNTHFVVTEDNGNVICCIPTRANLLNSLKIALEEHFDTEIGIPTKLPEAGKDGIILMNVRNVAEDWNISIEITPCWEYDYQ